MLTNFLDDVMSGIVCPDIKHPNALKGPRERQVSYLHQLRLHRLAINPDYRPYRTYVFQLIQTKGLESYRFISHAQ